MFDGGTIPLWLGILLGASVIIASGVATGSQTHDSMKLQMLMIQTRSGVASVLKDLTITQCATAKDWLLRLPVPSGDGAIVVYAECLSQ